MIVDIRTYTLKPGVMGAYLKAYGNNGWPIQLRYLPKCLGYYQVETGVQNRVVHIWQYQDIVERAKTRAAMEEDSAWLGYRAASGPFFVAQENKIMKDAPFWPKMKTVEKIPIGIVDKRTYFLAPGAFPEWSQIYANEAMETQIRHLGRCIGYYVSDIGAQHQIVHLWAYKDIGDRAERRAQMAEDPNWKAYVARIGSMGLFTHQENEILKPAPFWQPPGT